ncbi:MAG: hypothetical protein GY856_06365, partial [bacterium]|nr:hypothetical protein [bacterium]
MRSFTFLLLAAAAFAGAPTMKVQLFENSNPGFEECARQIEANFPRDLLARRGARIVKDGRVGPAGAQWLTDGSAAAPAGGG